MHLRRTALIITLLLLPLATHAEQSTSWSFIGGNVGPEWHTNGKATMTSDISGLLMHAETEMSIFRENNVIHDIDGIQIIYSAPHDLQAHLLWHVSGTPPDQVVELPFVLKASATNTSADLDIQWYKEWNPQTEIIGIQLPEGSTIKIVEIKLIRWNLFEKALSLVRSYWTFDSFTPYSVNFVWGPIVTASPFGQAQLFHQLPPRGHYASGWIYIVLILMIGSLALWGWRSGKRAQATTIVACLIAGAWILTDLRMGVEVMSYVQDDVESYWRKSQASRTFRERGDFRLFLDLSKPLLSDRARYVFVTQYPYPLLGLMRYHGYPALPVAPEASSGVDTWVAYDRPDITLNEHQQLSLDGNAITTPGTMLMELRAGTFVFRSQ